MSKWIAEFELEDGDTMPEHMDLNYMGARIDFHCRPLEQEPKGHWIYDDDAISRKDALDILDNMLMGERNHKALAIEQMKKLESIRQKYKVALEQEPCEDWNAVLNNVNRMRIPKTVLYSGDGYADGHMVYDMAECPNCGYEYEEGDKDWKEPFCPHCGQALSWEREE